MSSLGFSNVALSNVSQMQATSRTGPAQEQQIGQAAQSTPTAPATPAARIGTGDTVKISAAAQAQAMHSGGQSVSSIAAALGTSVSAVNGYLGITTTVSVPVVAVAQSTSSDTKTTSAAATTVKVAAKA